MERLKLGKLFILLMVLALVVIILFSASYNQPFTISLNTSAQTGGGYTMLEKSVNYSYCQIPPDGGFKSWKEGVVTTLTPTVGRNCTRLFAGEEGEIEKVKSQLTYWNNTVSDEDILEKTRNCSWVQSYLTDNLYATELERSFPIAFTYVVYNSPQQILRLFRVHYRQHNVYCIHPDKKSSKTFSVIFHNIATCLGNIIIPKMLIGVTRFTDRIMTAQKICMQELVQYREKQQENEKWKYIVNLCGKELPLTTTHTIIEDLTKLNGSSSIKTSKMGKDNLKRLNGRKIPYNLQGYKSWDFMALSHQFVNFLLTNETAANLFNFFKNCSAPEEHYFATVYMIPGVPGGYRPQLSQVYFETSSYFWLQGKRKWCGGKNVHAICMVSVTELKEILEKSKGGKQYLFHNKYFMEVDHVVMDCMEERIVTRNKMEYKHDCNIL